MAESKGLFPDNEYTIMSEIIDNKNVTQRQLSRILGVSVSTVNVLINKMIKEGFIKMTQVSQKQVFYMLTPVGMVEKAKKTVRYLKIHYRAIYELKEKIQTILKELESEHDVIFVLISDDEMGEMIGIAINELDLNNFNSALNVINIEKMIHVKEFTSPVLVHIDSKDKIPNEYTKLKGLTVIDLTERL